MKKIIIISIAISFIFCSCQDILTKTLELEDFDFEKQLVISGTLISSEEEFRLLVSENQAITEPLNDWQALEDAQVSIYKDGSLLSELAFEANAGEENEVDSLFVLDLNNVDVEPGTYRVEVSHPDFPTATATSTLPEEIPITSIVFEEDFGIAPNFLERTDAVLITINDPAEEKNYYSFTIETDTIVLDTFEFLGDTTFVEQELFVDIDSAEPNIIFTGGKVLFNDDFFNGTEHTIIFYVNSFFGRDLSEFKDNMEIGWEVMSKEDFEFTQSLNLYYDSQGFGPFSEAVSLFNNVEGGVGIFSTINRTFYDIP